MPKYKAPKGTAKGVARRRGAPVLYNELKKKLNLSLTPTTVNELQNAAVKDNVSISEFIERWVRSWKKDEPQV